MLVRLTLTQIGRLKSADTTIGRVGFRKYGVNESALYGAQFFFFSV